VPLRKAIAVVDQLIKKYPQIDTTRLYVTGVGSGGAGAFEAVAKHPHKFAALACLSGGYYPELFRQKQKATAWISYHEEEKDPFVIKSSNAIFDLFSSWGGDSRLVVYPSEDVNSWKTEYFDMNLYEWLFQQSL
jgi:predicted peptidase